MAGSCLLPSQRLWFSLHQFEGATQQDITVWQRQAEGVQLAKIHTANTSVGYESNAVQPFPPLWIPFLICVYSKENKCEGNTTSHRPQEEEIKHLYIQGSFERFGCPGKDWDEAHAVYSMLVPTFNMIYLDSYQVTENHYSLTPQEAQSFPTCPDTVIQRAALLTDSLFQ